MITDCLTEEQIPEDWKNTVHNFKFNLGILFIKNEYQVETQGFLKTVADSYTILDTSNMDKMNAALVDLMTRQFDKALQDIKSNSHQLSPTVNITFVAPFSTEIHADFLHINEIVGKLTITEGVGPRPQFMYYASQPDVSILYADKLAQSAISTSPQSLAISSLSLDIGAVVATLDTYYQELLRNTSMYILLQEAEKVWIAAETKLTRQIDGISHTQTPPPLFTQVFCRTCYCFRRYSISKQQVHSQTSRFERFFPIPTRPSQSSDNRFQLQEILYNEASRWKTNVWSSYCNRCFIEYEWYV
jgi:hypothetical protein